MSKTIASMLTPFHRHVPASSCRADRLVPERQGVCKGKMPLKNASTLVAILEKAVTKWKDKKPCVSRELSARGS
jgi:hypothetical protein